MGHGRREARGKAKADNLEQRSWASVISGCPFFRFAQCKGDDSGVIMIQQARADGTSRHTRAKSVIQGCVVSPSWMKTPSHDLHRPNNPRVANNPASQLLPSHL